MLYFIYISGVHLGACPFMNRMPGTTTDEQWSHDDLLRNTICSFCNNERLNPWYSCNRRSSMVNCHPGLLHERRQHYYIIKLLAKYAIPAVPMCGREITNRGLDFQGHPGATTQIHSYRIPHVSLPKKQQIKQYITHGKSIILEVILFFNKTHYSGNEVLCGADGFGIGVHCTLNSGCMSHGNVGDGTHGLSKGICMSAALLIAPLKEEVPMDFSKAFYMVDVSSITPLRLDVLRILNLAVTKNFWVSQG